MFKEININKMLDFVIFSFSFRLHLDPEKYWGKEKILRKMIFPYLISCGKYKKNKI